MEMSDYELLRERNIIENRKKLMELGLLKADSTTPKLEKPLLNPIRRSRSKSLGDRASSRRSSREFSASPLLSLPRRRSKRLASMNRDSVEFPKEIAQQILGGERSCHVSIVGENEETNAENNEAYYLDFDINTFVDDQKRKRRKIVDSHTVCPRIVPSVESITDNDLNRVCDIVSDKVYSQDGTTCHQCRQKTLDQKTYCRADSCYGIRGQFCGPCLKNRYGECVREALKNPDWNCPPCRGLCNCSICRTQKGKVPTGQLFPFAQARGYKSVHHFLEKEEEDDNEKVEDDNEKKHNNEKEEDDSEKEN